VPSAPASPTFANPAKVGHPPVRPAAIRLADAVQAVVDKILGAVAVPSVDNLHHVAIIAVPQVEIVGEIENGWEPDELMEGTDTHVSKTVRRGAPGWSIAHRQGWVYVISRHGSQNGNSGLEIDRLIN